MENIWDIRYNDFGVAYGMQPNVFFRQTLDSLQSGKLLLPAEGEGRNAVYAAQKGWKVDAYDQSKVAKENALKLASETHVEINYQLAEHLEFPLKPSYYNAIALIYAHVTPDVRKQLHHNVCLSLAPKGIIILEAFDKEQISRTSGGPKAEELLFDLDELISDFSSLKIIKATKEEVLLDEGTLHKGWALVNRIIAEKTI
ncbi:MAG: class I SAM-dependent methyltransferase [Bacteroidota bacterium]